MYRRNHSMLDKIHLDRGKISFGVFVEIPGVVVVNCLRLRTYILILNRLSNSVLFLAFQVLCPRIKKHNLFTIVWVFYWNVFKSMFNLAIRWLTRHITSSTVPRFVFCNIGLPTNQIKCK